VCSRSTQEQKGAAVNILACENIDPEAIDRLRADGHQVYSIYESARGVDDATVMRLASVQQAVIVTKDKDFGDLVFVQHLSAPGIVLLRLAGLTAQQIADRVAAVVGTYGAALYGRLTVVGPASERSTALP
jgi:predicted nuclease of predicted toxin-antitoxin system